MQNKARLSIDEDINGQVPKEPIYTPVGSLYQPLFNKYTGQTQSIHKNSSMPRQDRQTGRKMTTQPSSLIICKPNTRYSRQVQTQIENNKQSYKLGFMPVNQNNRITFNKQPTPNKNMINSRQSNYKSERKIRKYGGIPVNYKQQHSKRYYNNEERQDWDQNNINKDQGHSVKSNLQKVVQDLEEHNKSIIKQTKQTVLSFQNYIEQLLQTNRQMQSRLQQYQSYIQLLQNQRTQSLQFQTERQRQLQKIIKQKLAIKKQLDVSSTYVINELKNELDFGYKKISNLKHQVNSKNDLIRLLQQSVQEKQKTIKKMAKFNNQMCLQIINMKGNGVQTNSSQLHNSYQKSQVSYIRQKNMQELQRKIQQLQKENDNIRKQKQYFQDKIKQIGNDDQIIIMHLQKQQSLIKMLASSVKFNNAQNKQIKNQGAQPNVLKSGVIKKNKRNNKNNLGNNGSEDDLYNDGLLKKIESFSEILPNLNQNKTKEQQNQKQLNYVILNKIANLLKMLSSQIKSSKKRNKYSQALTTIVKVISQINIQQQSHQFLNRESDDNIFEYFQSDQLETHKVESLDTIQKKNQIVVEKVKKIRQKLRTYISDAELSEKEQSGRQVQHIQHKNNFRVGAINSEVNYGFKNFQTNYWKNIKQNNSIYPVQPRDNNLRTLKIGKNVYQ